MFTYNSGSKHSNLPFFVILTFNLMSIECIVPSLLSYSSLI